MKELYEKIKASGVTTYHRVGEKLDGGGSDMKKSVIIWSLIFISCFVALTGCDPVYPPGKLKVKKIGSISTGSSIDVEIIYPYEGGSIVTDWKNQNIEIVSGDDIISVSGLTITGLKPGTARIKVSATTVIDEYFILEGREEKIYSMEVNIKVK